MPAMKMEGGGRLRTTILRDKDPLLNLLIKGRGQMRQVNILIHENGFPGI